jgi:hypothetical protein
MSNRDIANIKKFQCAFLELTETNQLYILGLVDGLKYAQEESKNTPVGILPDGKVFNKVAE